MKTISFARGVPSADLLPGPEISAAAQRALVRDAAGALAYGAPEGYRPLRDWFAQRYAVPVERVLVTNGSLQGVALLIEHLFAGKGGLAVVEAPTYDRTILLFKRFGATVEALALGADGIDVDALERLCRSGRTPRVVYVIPNFQNPAGVTTSRAKRERLVALATEHDFLLLEDDPYHDVRFEGADEPTMLSMDRSLHVIHMTSMTKTVAPGVRVGAVILPPALFGPIRQLANDTFIAPGHLAQATVAEYCAAGSYEPGLTRVRARLRERRDAMVAALDRTLGKRVSYVTPQGGYFLWIKLPGVDADALAAEADKAGVPVVRGSSCYPDGRGKDELRLAFSAVTPEDITEGIQRLASLVR
jgi:DNA-binding transcriptional MocR family regulator